MKVEMKTHHFLKPLKFVAIYAALAASSFAQGTGAAKPYTTWAENNGTADSANYSSLTQINRSNVNQLQVAWTYDSGDKAAYTFQPLVVGRVMYGVAHNGSLVAVDATNGKELWVHTFGGGGSVFGGGGLSGYRGLNFWQSKDGSDQ